MLALSTGSKRSLPVTLLPVTKHVPFYKLLDIGILYHICATQF